MSYSREELARDLRKLASIKVARKEDLDAWYEEARRVQMRLMERPGVPLGTSDFPWHYLSDADIRLKDPEYARMQNERLTTYLVELESGLPMK